MVTALDKNIALVIIDLQKGVVKMPGVHAIEPVINNTLKLVAAFRKEGLPIVLVNVKPDTVTMAKTRIEGSPVPRPAAAPFPEEFYKIIPEIEIHADDILITKHTWSAFYETALNDELKKRNITGIVLAGVATSIGVEGTARNASERGYNISFAKDAMTDRILAAHENSLQHIFPRIGEVDDTDVIIGKLSERI